MEERFEVVYDAMGMGDGFCIQKDENGRYYFSDANDFVPLACEIENPGDIIYDECDGWMFSDGTELPWA